MRLYRWLFCWIQGLIPVLTAAQAIDNTPAFRNINSNHYVRIYYENDYFTGTDRDYTQGVYLECINPALQHNPLSALLWRPKHATVNYGLAVEHEAYTPNNLNEYNIIYGDRPYAAVLFFKTFLMATNTARRERITTLLSTGIIGAWAGGEDMQKTIHRWINYILPLGWHNQINNDIILNYQLNYERELYALPAHFSVAAYGSARVGTLSDKATAGVSLMTGNFYDPYKDNATAVHKKVQYYLYAQPVMSLVVFDATLQGGLFDRGSPYTIPNKDVNRVVLLNRFGLVIIFKRMYLEYYQSMQTREFQTSVPHRSGGVQFGFGF
ncbi:hypothetical protein CLV51_108176 [Chitinophaga niastensis]|uniref:Lipid A deacylase LpxR family protein n=1 Tax=Chitinophaga niastensis TaxID=536980 RepID=A0A2P8HB83_CHINA|nr:lipid A deacylase LpxR family protein [Chitinophaga niastensis]PSL43486.1 hypothetical protein CLV51_108176 [Chitinophaga niastensis]